MPRRATWATMLFLLPALPATAGALPDPPAVVYWCPSRASDQQYSATPASDCTALAESKKKKKDGATGQESIEPRKPFPIERLQSETALFLRHYRQFLDCCADSVESLEDVEDLEEQAGDLLRDVQQSGLVNMHTNQRGITLREIIRPVAQARDDLRRLKQRLEQVGHARDRAAVLDYEAAGRERRRIQQDEELIRKEFRPSRPPESARTGTDVGDTTLPNRAGPALGGGNTPASTLPTATGTDIGTVVSPASDQQTDLRPRRGLDTHESTLAPRHGPLLKDTTLPNTTGFEIDAMQGPTGTSTTPTRAGPSIGDSSLNSH